ncbi:G-protein coupled receptor [Biomphalaria pfeifferi]|uniref:G-protein coupled receptor n=1 Tax=Biomphalaria pfeifferi TaxID=112525 RepID=A0AAD8AQK7_BIOPF|nr:G-protein coupled receptor [Biomphalaria pfeifferi]
MSVLSVDVYHLCLQILHVPLSVFVILGILTNGVNIVVFVKQGVTSGSITWALFAMSATSFLASVILLPQVVCYYAEMVNADVCNACSLISTATIFLHLIWNKVTCFFTVYISVERAICVVRPLHVQTYMKLQYKVFIVLSLCVVTTLAYVGYSATLKIAWVPSQVWNGTMVFLLSQTDSSSLFYLLNFIVNSLVVTNVAIVTIATSAVVMVTRLNATRRWRESVTHTARPAHPRKGSKPKPSCKLSSKNVKLCRTVVVITLFYLACLLCSHLPVMTFLVMPGVSFDGENKMLLDVILTIRFDLDALYSSFNIFFYLKLSSNYREIFFSLFNCPKLCAR